MHVVDDVFFAGWAAFWIFWLVAAVAVKEGQGGLTWLAGFRVAAIGFVVVFLPRLRGLRGHAVHDPWLWGTGLALWVLGLGLAIFARLYLGRNWGMPMTQRADPDLVQTGPYRFVRHPIYSGILLGLIGTAVAVSVTWFAAAVVVGGYFIVSAVVEERTMTRRFPDAYPAYKRSTKMLVPFIL